MQGSSPESRDFIVLRLFHQFLFIRFREDQQARASDVVLSELDPEEDLRVPISTALNDYREHLNSELFSPLDITVAELPPRALGDVIRQLVEPWAKLRLDFSVSRTEIAGRLYQSYLYNLPKREPEQAQTRLFARAYGVDERARAASYYTPPALARYVVEEALGDWLKHHRPKRPEDVRVLDPACGSGAFLIAAYRRLLHHFSDLRGHELRPFEREEILRTCIYGSDVDERALGLAQVQLLEEAHVSGRLPRLGRNLVQGDALAAPPGVPAQQGQVPWTTILDELSGRFSVVVANPPFGSHVKMPRRVEVTDLNAIQRQYPEVASFGRDYAYVFIALALRLLREAGAIGLVLPRTLLDGVSGLAARRLLADNSLRLLVDFRAAQLFDVRAYVCVAVSGPVAVTGPDDRVEVASITDSRTDSRSLLDQLTKHRGYDISYRRTTRRQLARQLGEGWSAFRLRWELNLRHELSVNTTPLIPDPGGTRIARWGTKPGAIKDFVTREERVEDRRSGSGCAGCCHVARALCATPCPLRGHNAVLDSRRRTSALLAVRE
jgi:methylase of polypeptide subunit release factors